MTKSIYIAGPMSGIPDWNYPSFFRVAKKLRKNGWTVYNPAEKDMEEGSDQTSAKATGNTAQAIKEGVFDYRKSYMWDIDKVVNGDAIFMLRGWEQSPGARGEHAAAVFCAKHNTTYQIVYE